MSRLPQTNAKSSRANDKGGISDLFRRLENMTRWQRLREQTSLADTLDTAMPPRNHKVGELQTNLQIRRSLPSKVYVQSKEGDSNFETSKSTATSIYHLRRCCRKLNVLSVSAQFECCCVMLRELPARENDKIRAKCTDWSECPLSLCSAGSTFLLPGGPDDLLRLVYRPKAQTQDSDTCVRGSKERREHPFCFDAKCQIS